jgi:hypothetical protein
LTHHAVTARPFQLAIAKFQRYHRAGMLLQLLNKAFAATQKVTAQKAATEAAQPLAQLQKQRAKDWLDELAGAFRVEFSRAKQFRVFSRDHAANAAFGLDDLMFDISVCKVAKIKSAELDGELEYVAEAVWQVQTQFSTDARDAVNDFNKLVMGGAANRLLVGPIVHSPGYLRTLAVPAKGCAGAAVYLAMVAHPSRWPASDAVRLYRFDGEKWATEDEGVTR